MQLNWEVVSEQRSWGPHTRWPGHGVTAVYPFSDPSSVIVSTWRGLEGSTLRGQAAGGSLALNLGCWGRGTSNGGGKDNPKSRQLDSALLEIHYSQKFGSIFLESFLLPWPQAIVNITSVPKRIHARGMPDNKERSVKPPRLAIEINQGHIRGIPGRNPPRGSSWMPSAPSLLSWWGFVTVAPVPSILGSMWAATALVSWKAAPTRAGAGDELSQRA